MEDYRLLLKEFFKKKYKNDDEDLEDKDGKVQEEDPSNE